MEAKREKVLREFYRSCLQIPLNLQQSKLNDKIWIAIIKNWNLTGMQAIIYIPANLSYVNHQKGKVQTKSISLSIPLILYLRDARLKI